MTFLGSTILITSLLIVPFVIGSLMPSKGRLGLRTFVYGYVIEWALFYPVAIGLILPKKSFTLLTKVYSILLIIVMLLGLVSFVIKALNMHKQKTSRQYMTKPEIIYLGIFIALLGFQIYKSIFYAYADGDDAFYTATALSTNITDKMYTVDPYLGLSLYTEQLNYRYALAPFPIWISYLSRISKIHAATVSHVFLPVPLILVTYVIYSEISKALFKNDRTKRYMFMVLASVYVLFSNVSTSTAETFLLTRARQGKEALANIALPLLFLLLLEIHESLKEDACKIKISRMIPVWVVCVASSLMSVFSGVLAGVALFAFFLIMLFEKRKLRTIFDAAVLAVPSAISVLLYLILG